MYGYELFVTDASKPKKQIYQKCLATVPLEERHLYKTLESLQKRGFLENIYLDGLPQQMDIKERIGELAID